MVFQVRTTMGLNFVHLFILCAFFPTLSTTTPVTFVDKPCPVPCNDYPPELWTTYHDLLDLDACAGTLLFQTHLYNGLEDPKAGTFFRSCTASQAPQPKGDNAGRIAKKHKRQFLSLNTTAPRSAKVQVVSGEGSRELSTEDVQSALTSLSAYMDSQDTDEDSPEMPMLTTYAKRGNAFVGTYVGMQVQRHAAATVVATFSKQFSSTTIAAQACGSPEYNKTTALQVFGIVVDSDASVVQKTLRDWHEAKCLSSGQLLGNASIDFVAGALIPVSPQKPETLQKRDSELGPRATCKYTQMQSGDGCWALADRCGITQAQLEGFNGGSSFCTSPNPKVRFLISYSRFAAHVNV
jgi:chitinase